MSSPVFPVSATVRTWKWVVIAKGGWRRLDLAVRYGLWQRPAEPPILIDTGYGYRTCKTRERSAPLKIYGGLLRPRLNPENLVAARLASLGYSMDEVQLTIVTHFHPDHIDGLKDLPKSRFLASKEMWSATSSLGRVGRTGSGVFLELLPLDFRQRLSFIEDLPLRVLPFGLGEGYDVLGDGELFAVPLGGHAPGHFGLLWPNLDQPLLYAADAQWLWRAVSEDRAPWLATRLVAHDGTEALKTMARLRAFADAGGEVVLCHDPSPSSFEAVGREA